MPNDSFGPPQDSWGIPHVDPARFDDERANTGKRFDNIIARLERIENKVDAQHVHMRDHSHPHYVQWAALIPFVAAVATAAALFL